MERADPAGHGHPQEQVVVLGPVVLGAEDPAAPGGAEQQVAADGGEVADVVGPQQREQVEGRLGGVEADPVGLLGDLRLVAEDQVRLGLGVQAAGEEAEGRGVQQVIVVEDRQEVAAGALDRAVAGAADAEVLLQLVEPDAIVAVGPATGDLQVVAAAAAVVDQQQLPADVGLAADREDQLLEQPRRGVPHRRQQREEHRPGAGRPARAPAPQRRHQGGPVLRAAVDDPGHRLQEPELGRLLGERPHVIAHMVSGSSHRVHTPLCYGANRLPRLRRAGSRRSRRH